MTSSSSENAGNITIEIEKGQDINNILAEVKNAVDKVPNFPSAMEPPVIGKIENIRETIVLIVTGENADLFALKSTARKIENEIRKIDGISQIEIEGFPNEEIEIATSEKTLRSYAITFSELASAIARNSLLSTGGMIKTRSENLLIRAKNNG